MNIVIDFNGYLCDIGDLNKYLQGISWEGIKAGERLYYSSDSPVSYYDLKVSFVSDTLVKLYAISDTD